MKTSPFTKFFEGRSDDSLWTDDAVPADSDVGKITANDGLGLDDVLSV